MYLLKRHINVEVEVLSRMETLLSQAPILVLADTSVNNNISGSVSSQDVEHSILKRNIRLELNSFDISKEALMQSVTMTFLTMSIKKFKEGLKEA
ncbi:hypothetical protein RO3G_14109 [Rhizopus delemar RA 99-880]|uniref:Uncharacterized protein n=1 Tax=Rhizopus delemar (strain RA 99-880 / ATCC MYA-4621 / FGSC 9543 / NRRL 43880) TaxID=246409 RepID=I1CLR8_RHIO9|nr:hypothetical protein RO3G_14109 [Rhizopus delemar RA 99-880]|eukprot:EIE89398.1 hypothetical protein RO3G_14109 [Rhizopus delemar RA 99-880]